MVKRYAQMALHRLQKLMSGEWGNVSVLTSLSVVALLAMTGLAVDGGMLMAAKAQMQKAANAAALSAAQELTNTEAAVRAVAEEVLRRHGEDAHLDMLDIVLEDKVRIGLSDHIPLGFAGIFGIDSARVSVSAAAEIGVMGAAMGAAPLGIDENIELIYGQEYKLKVDQTGVEAGYFGILALGGPGASTYEDNLRFGYKGLIKIGDILDTQTGNIAGKTRSSIQERVTNCSYSIEEVQDHRDCSRVLLIPVYEPYDFTSNQLKKVKVTGFAYFYITEPMSSKATYITGKFIKRTGTGFFDSGAVDKGAYVIRLTE